MNAEAAPNLEPETEPVESRPAQKAEAKTVEAPGSGQGRLNRAGVKISKFRSDTASRVEMATGKLDEFMQRILRVDEPEAPDQDPYFFPPKGFAKSVGDAADGTLLTPPRRAWEGVHTGGAMLRAAKRTFIDPIPFIGHFRQTVFHPFRWMWNPARFVTSGFKMASHVLAALPRAQQELLTRGFSRPAKRFEEVPLLGKPVSIVGGAAGWLSTKARNVGEYATLAKPIGIVDQAVAEKQNR